MIGVVLETQPVIVLQSITHITAAMQYHLLSFASFTSFTDRKKKIICK